MISPNFGYTAPGSNPSRKPLWLDSSDQNPSSRFAPRSPDEGEQMGRVPLLILHRDRFLLQTLPELLEKNGFAVDFETDDASPDQLARQEKYKVILVDPYDPALGGEDILQRWRRDGVTAHIVAMSDMQSVEAKVQCFDLGADDYLSTPLDPSELLARLRVVLRRSQADSTNTAAVLKTHDLVIDTAAGKVTRNAQPIVLTPREFALLRLLAIRKGRVVSRSKIWECLYDQNSLRSSNVVDVYIRRLRVKIDKDFETPLILTRFGQGYMLRDDQS